MRPSMMLKLRRADAVVENGLDLDAWADVAIEGANNPEIIRGGRGRIEISKGIEVLEVPSARVDRSMGDVHPRGNPHFSLDPGLAPAITQNIVDGLARVAPESRAVFEQNRTAFLAQLAQRMAEWTKTMEPLRGSKVVVFHPDFIYLLTRFGLVAGRHGGGPAGDSALAAAPREPDPPDEGGEDQGRSWSSPGTTSSWPIGSPRRPAPRPS